jgi:hypothetical protein
MRRMAGQSINIFLGNHPYVAQETLRDMCMAFSGTLTALGHRVLISADIQPPPALNLFFEHFPPEFAAVFEPILPHIRAGLICTEPFQGNPMSDSAYREMRIQNMIRIGSQCRFVWCLDPASYDGYKMAFGHSNVLPFSIGFIESLVDLPSVGDTEKVWDVCFTGSMTEYRQKVFAALTSAGLRVVHGLFPHYLRQSVMARSRLQLTLKQSEAISIPSQMRMSYCLANDLPVISDLGGRPPETGVETYVPAVAPEGLVEWCRRFAAGEQDRGAFEARIHAFKNEYRMDHLNAETVRLSLSL